MSLDNDFLHIFIAAFVECSRLVDISFVSFYNNTIFYLLIAIWVRMGSGIHIAIDVFYHGDSFQTCMVDVLLC